MFTRVNCYVHDSHYDECLELVKKINGVLSSVQPERKTDSHYVEVEANFKNLNDANSFIYKMFFRYGLHFYVEQMQYVSKYF